DAPRGPIYRLTETGAAQPADAVRRKAARQADVLACLAAGARTAAELRQAAGATAATLRRLVELGWIEALQDGPRAGCVPDARGAPPPRPDADSVPASDAPTLTDDQRNAIERIREGDTPAGACLLYGVTGSGKTEVFLSLVAEELAVGRQSLLLVPEIGLTPQLVGRLEERFGAALAVMHSVLPAGERLAAWRPVRHGRAGVVVGTRSAVFAPLVRPGLIVVDEEHDASYKQQQGFRYSARDVAVLRAHRLGVPVVLASATPSLESFHNARSGRYRLIEMPKRIGAGGAPRIRVVDLGKHASRQGLSTPLLDAMDRHLANGR